MDTGLLLSFLSGIGGGGLITILLRTYLTERIKNKIRTEYKINFVSAKKELEKKATEHQIHYSKLHIDRSEVVKEIFNLLINSEEKLELLTSLKPKPEEVQDKHREEDANSAIEQLENTLLRNRIYFDIEFIDKLNSLIENCKKVIEQMGEIKNYAKHEKETGQRIGGNPHKEWIDLNNRVHNEISDARKVLEIEFRTLLGVK